MRTTTIIETAEELIEFARLSRPQDGRDPYIDPQEVSLILDGGVPRLAAKNRDFELEGDISMDDILQAMAKECNIHLYLI